MVKEQNRIMLFPILKMTVLRNDKHKEKTHKKTQKDCLLPANQNYT